MLSLISLIDLLNSDFSSRQPYLFGTLIALKLLQLLKILLTNNLLDLPFPLEIAFHLREALFVQTLRYLTHFLLTDDLNFILILTCRVRAHLHLFCHLF